MLKKIYIFLYINRVLLLKINKYINRVNNTYYFFIYAGNLKTGHDAWRVQKKYKKLSRAST